MRTDHITSFNDTSGAYAKHVAEMIAMKKAELARLEKVLVVVNGIGSTEQMIGDPAINGDQEPLPAVARPIAPAEPARELRNGRPVVAAADQAAA
jgi:hypothetical protein